MTAFGGHRILQLRKHGLSFRLILVCILLFIETDRHLLSGGRKSRRYTGLSLSWFLFQTEIVEILIGCNWCSYKKKMLNILRSRCIAHSSFLAPLQSRWSSSIEHTLQVRKDIESKRELSRQGGGPKRIASQHKKVCLH